MQQFARWCVIKQQCKWDQACWCKVALVTLLQSWVVFSVSLTAIIC